MAGFERILACTDGTDRGLAAVVTGAAIAGRGGAQLHLLRVVESLFIADSYVPPGLRPQELEEGFVDEARATTEAQAREAGAPDAPIHIQEGVVARTIVAMSDQLDADLLVLGAHPQPAIARFLVGSTAERAIRISRRPILVAAEPRHEPFERVLVAVDLSEQSRHVLEAAATLAMADDAELRALHVQEPLPPMVVEADAFNEQEHRRHGVEHLEEWVQETGTPGLSVERRTREGRAGQGILAEATDWGADLIVVGTHGFGFFERLLLGSTSLHVLRHGERTTLIVPPEPEEDAP